MNFDPVLLWPVAAALAFGPMVFRLLNPIPKADLDSIYLFLKNRNQSLIRMRKLWIGGPGRWSRALYSQYGRPYRLLVMSPDGSTWKHHLAMLDEADGLGSPVVMQRSESGWSRVIQ